MKLLILLLPPIRDVISGFCPSGSPSNVVSQDSRYQGAKIETSNCLGSFTRAISEPDFAVS
jgi:hypothetical protein